MIEQIEHIKKFALQDNSALTVKQLGEAIARMCDDAIREAVEHSVHADKCPECEGKGMVALDNVHQICGYCDGTGICR